MALDGTTDTIEVVRKTNELETDQRGGGAEQVARARRFLNAHGAVPRRALTERLDQLRDAPVIHMHAGVGWGKTAAVLELGLARVAEGYSVRVATMQHPGGAQSDVPPFGRRSGSGRRRMLLLDEVAPPEGYVDRLADEIAAGADVRLVVASRGEHPVVERIRERGLAVSVLGAEALRILPDELRAMAKRRGVALGPSSSEYVARMVDGWPVVLNRFVEEAGRVRATHMSAALTDRLLASSIRRVVGPLLDGNAIDELSTAALADRIDDDVVTALGLSPRLNDALAQVGALGLGTWQQ